MHFVPNQDQINKKELENKDVGTWYILYYLLMGLNHVKIAKDCVDNP
jgi:hypothetical protein